VRFDREFDLAVMTGHAFQVFLTDAEVRQALTSVHRALTDGGRFAFETRNPTARAWERWTPEHGTDFTAADGAPVRWEADVVSVSGELVTFRSSYRSRAWKAPLESASTLRFVNVVVLDRFLIESGFTIEARHGDWDRSPFVEDSPEIITIAGRSALR
jgi:hypothetical protein